jgi:deoxyadenosine/deoxycytidine kinase
MDLLDNMMEELNSLEKKSPDLFIYLRGSFETVLHRMNLRGRSFELENPDNYEYFKRLHARYDDWVFNRYKASQILIIDMDKYDVHNPDHEKIILTQLDLKLSTMNI